MHGLKKIKSIDSWGYLLVNKSDDTLKRVWALPSKKKIFGKNTYDIYEWNITGYKDLICYDGVKAGYSKTFKNISKDKVEGLLNELLN